MIATAMGVGASLSAVACIGAWMGRRYFRNRVMALGRAESAPLSDGGSMKTRNNETDCHPELAHLARVSMVGELSGAIAHELNQPLTAILTNAQAAQRMLNSEKCDPHEVYDILTDIVSQDKRAVQVIQRLRALLTKDSTEVEVLDPAECSQEVLSLADGTLVARKVRVSAVYARDVPEVLVDRVQIQQVLLNLILNASDAMTDSRDDEHRLLTIATSLASDGAVLITVSDSGPGIPADELAKLFEPYYTTKRNGLGLGLSISKTIVDAHGGRIWAVNNPEVGATFCFTLPAAVRERSTAEGPGIARSLATCFL
jgi:two-component system, LuxR family, sensor kinase FixL